MKNMKRLLSILLACLVVMAVVPMAVSAAGTQDDPIDAATKWFGYGVDTYLLNPSIEAGSDGMWYTLTAEKDGILALEHKYKDVDYTITISVNGKDYVGGSVDGVIYNGPIMTLPMKTGDVATIAIVTKDAAAGTVYASMNIIAGNVDNSIKVKSAGITVYVAAGQTVYFQDDSLQAVYATKGLLVSGNVADTTFYTVTKNTESGSTSQKAYTDTDADNTIEVTLGGSLGGAGAPPVKPAWAIENTSAVDQTYTLTIVDKAQESVLPLEITGNSVSPGVNGLAWLIEATVDGIEVGSDNKIVYDNAAVNGGKLITMGAVISNNYATLGHVPNLDDVDNVFVVDVEAQYLYDTNEEQGTVTFAIRAVEIPDEYKDYKICILPYVIFEDASGVQQTQYCKCDYKSYNECQ